MTLHQHEWVRHQFIGTCDVVAVGHKIQNLGKRTFPLNRYVNNVDRCSEHSDVRKQWTLDKGPCQ
jgi:hypothetical protein